MDMYQTRSTLNNIRKVYSWLGDEESRLIFREKLLYQIVDPSEKNICLHRIWQYREPERYRKLQKICSPDNEVILYGAGDYCASVADACRWLSAGQKKVRYVVDSNTEKQGQKGPYGIDIISPERLFADFKDAYVVISSLTAHREIYQYLCSHMDPHQIFEFAVDYEEEIISHQYFDADLIKYKEDGEVFVDCGCFDFATSRYLSEKCSVKKVYAFEADPLNIEKIRRGVEQSNIRNVEIFDKGVWSKKGTLHFMSNGTTAAYAADEAGADTVDVEVVSLDETIKEPVSFIKMDIEGSELEALKGAKGLIAAYMPKLAVSAYHKPEDMIDLALYIKELVPEYKLYLRHYSNFDHETVLYALP